VSIVYQYRREFYAKKKANAPMSKEMKRKSMMADDKSLEMAQHCNRYGYLDKDESTGLELKKYKLKEEEEKKRIQKELLRSKKWAPMILHWDDWMKKKPKKVLLEAKYDRSYYNR
jgi:hypothetical protein